MKALREINQSIQPIADQIAKLREHLGNIEENYYSCFHKQEKRKIIIEKIDIKLEQLLDSYTANDRIIINAGGSLFETTKSVIDNCRYDNVLKEILANTKETEIMLDIEGSLFEVILEIIRYTHKENDKINLIAELQEQLAYGNINIQEVDYLSKDLISKNQTKKTFRIYDKESDHESKVDILIENIKLLFPKTWHELLDEIEIKGYDRGKKTEEEIKISNIQNEIYTNDDLFD